MSTEQKKDPFPPRLPEWIIQNLAWDEDRLSIRENLREEYIFIAETKGTRWAALWYWGHMIRSIFPFVKLMAYWRFVMLKNYMKVAFRNFAKHKSFSFINIAGLAIGMACCMLITLWVQDELNYERFNENIDDIFCVVQWNAADQTKAYGPSIPSPLVPYLKEKYAGIKHASRYKASGRRLFSYEGNNVYEDNGGFADPEIFDVFSFKAVLNDPKVALKDINTIILSESMAERYFGPENPIGKTIQLENQYDFMVGAVIADIPKNSSVRFDYLVQFDNFGLFDKVEMDNWGRYENYLGFVVLESNVDPEDFSEKIANGFLDYDSESTHKIALYPYKKIRLFGFNNDGTFKFVLVFAAIGVLILLIACINFINLTTAQSGKRAKEIGLRKVVGAGKSSIRRQIYSELFVTVSIAFILAIALSIAFLPRLNTISDKTLSLSITGNSSILIAMFGIALLTAVISGTYPAFYLSSFSPVNVMKTSASTGPSHSNLRKGLVVAQFAISIVLIISTIIITGQMRYIQKKDLGFDKDHLVYTDLLGDLKTRFDTVKNELKRDPNINSVTVAQSLPNFAGNNAGGLDWEGRPADVRGNLNFVSVEKDYFETVGIEFIEGETFKTVPDNMLLREFIINEKAIEAMKIENPVGKSFKMWDRDAGRIVGIVKNVHNTSLHREIQPAFYVQFPYFYNYLIINLKSDNVTRTIGFIRDTVKEINPDYPFEFHFLDENIDRFYQKEKRINRIITSFAILAVFISCLGLFGLSLFMAEQRTKEIGIRKTLGATVSSIVGLMSRDFLLLIAAANVIAWPVSYFVMKKWLQNFAYRIDMSLWIFVLAAGLTLLIALVTISFQTLRAAAANPVNSLRYE
jgi:putative ABC transport system permease protein